MLLYYWMEHNLCKYSIPMPEFLVVYDTWNQIFDIFKWIRTCFHTTESLATLDSITRFDLWLLERFQVCETLKHSFKEMQFVWGLHYGRNNFCIDHKIPNTKLRTNRETTVSSLWICQASYPTPSFPKLGSCTSPIRLWVNRSHNIIKKNCFFFWSEEI